MSEQEPTPEQALLTATTKFAQTLLSAGCPVEFICTQAFKYAMLYQWQVDVNLDFAQNVIKGREPSLIEPENTVYMDRAAQVLVQVVTALEIHPDQRKREEATENGNQVEPNYKQILINLCAGVCLADHLGDIEDDVNQALILAGILTREETREFEDARQRTGFLVLEHKATTVYGTSLADE